MIYPVASPMRLMRLPLTATVSMTPSLAASPAMRFIRPPMMPPAPNLIWVFSLVFTSACRVKVARTAMAVTDAARIVDFIVIPPKLQGSRDILFRNEAAEQWARRGAPLVDGDDRRRTPQHDHRSLVHAGSSNRSQRRRR